MIPEEFAIGEQVQMKNNHHNQLHMGYVTSLQPLKVSGHEWDSVRKLERQKRRDDLPARCVELAPEKEEARSARCGGNGCAGGFCGAGRAASEHRRLGRD